MANFLAFKIKRSFPPTMCLMNAATFVRHLKKKSGRSAARGLESLSVKIFGPTQALPDKNIILLIHWLFLKRKNQIFSSISQPLPILRAKLKQEKRWPKRASN